MKGLNNPIGIKSLEPNQNPFIINPYRFAGAGGVGGWVQLARTTLGSSGDTITVSSLDDKRYYMILGYGLDTGGTIGMNPRLNGDTDENYASRQSQNGGSDTAQNSSEQGRWADTNASDHFGVLYLSNLSSEEKLMIGHSNQQAGTGATAPSRFEAVSKWTNASNAVNSFTIQNFGTGSYDTNSEVVVLGWDPADTHTDNFWEELYTDSQTGQSTDNIDTGTFTNKKYLWVQLWCKGTGDTTVKATFNNSTDSTYAYRASNDGGSEITVSTLGTNFVLHNTKANDDKFVNMFIVNDGTNEILGIAHTAEGNSDGADVAPQRRETVFKRSIATAITDIEFDNDDSGSFTDWELRVWGSN